MGGDEIKVELNDQKNGTYLAEYTVDKLCGKLTLSVFLRGAHIKSSPFSVLVEHPNLPQRNVPSRREDRPAHSYRRVESLSGRRRGRYEGRIPDEILRDQAISFNVGSVVTFD